MSPRPIFSSSFLALTQLFLVTTSQAADPATLINQSTRARVAGQCLPGPWGKLSYHEAYLEAPKALLNYFPLPSTTTCWSIGSNGMEEFTQVLLNAGIPATSCKALLDPQQVIRMNTSLSIFPPAEFLMKLTPEARLIIYSYLGQRLENEFIKNPVFFGRAGVDHWLKGTALSERVQSLFRKLAWKRGEAWVISDLELLLSQAASSDEAREIFRTCSRTRTLILDLTIDDPTSIASLRKYWAAGMNQQMAEPFLESMREAASQGAMHCDVCHLFSPIARQLLYTYPDMSSARHGRLPDCHWTSLNFFNHAPREYYIDTRLAADAVLTDYTKVDAPYNFGDVLFFLKDGGAIHSCVQIADDIVYTKNGDNAVAPWMLAHLLEVQDVYAFAPGVTIQGFRKKEPSAEKNDPAESSTK